MKRRKPIDELVESIEAAQRLLPPELVAFARHWHGRTGRDAVVCRKFWEWVASKMLKGEPK